MKPVTGVGAPWYTSGVQEWNGTALTLNSRPTASRPIPASSIAFLPVVSGSAAAIPPSRIEPVTP